MSKERTRRLWRNKWFLSLPPLHKTVVEYVRAHCDSCGVWEFDRTMIEMKIGFENIAPAWVHSSIRGIEFATRELAEEDAEARNLDVDKVRQKELPKWSSIVSAINKEPLKWNGSEIPAIEIIGENRWWFVRLIEHEFGRPSFGKRPATLRLDETASKYHRAAIKALRASALLNRFREYYPGAEIIEAPGAIPNPENEVSPPSPEMVLGAPEGGRLPPAERKMFWLDHNRLKWACGDEWRNLLAAEEKLWLIKFDYTQLTGRHWPETKKEAGGALGVISEELMAENANRVEINGQLRLPPEAMARVKTLLRAKELMEEKR